MKTSYNNNFQFTNQQDASSYTPSEDGGTWYNIQNIDSIDSPALVVYKERVAENIRLLKSMVCDKVDHLRPHVKTNKIAEVCQMMLDAGITKFKCATIAEAEMLALIKAPDVLLSYQPVGPKAERLFALIEKYPSTFFSCLVDNMDAAMHLSKIFSEKDQLLNVFIDINTGMNRTGILPSHALQLFEAVDLLAYINVIGLHAYDGHIRDTDVSARKNNVDAAFSKVIILAETIEAITKQSLIIVAGGSPTFPIHAERKDVECSPGTFVFWDWGYKHGMPDEPFDYAALVITRVISIVDEHTITTDLGHKSVAAENPFPRVHFLNAPKATPISQSEEHLVAKVPDASAFKIGDVLYGVPVHICPTVALYERAIVIEDNSAVDEWKVIARDRRINI
ncbi:MAG: D-TA family PLP-dependent enzyme [Panacibacter sp.]